MKRKRNGLIRLENIFMASIAAVAVAVCAAPFVDVTATQSSMVSCSAPGTLPGDAS